MSATSFDVVIAGAGPAGCACALALKGSGLRVALLDKARFPRDKVCGDALSGKAISALRYLDPAIEAALHQLPQKSAAYGIRFVSPAGEALDVPFRSRLGERPQPPGYVSRRMDFDAFLFEQVRSSGAALCMEEFDIRRVRAGAGGLTVSGASGEVQARLLIGADGAQSVVARQLAGMALDPAHHSAGVRAYYRNVGGLQPEGFIELHFLRELLPGYLWIFPLPNGAANVGLGMLSRDLSRLKLNLRERLPQLLATHPALAPRFREAQPEGPVQGFGLPLGSLRRRLSGEGFMLAGDAAALIDPFTGEGIGNALLSGRIAAAVAVEAFDKQNFSADFLKTYDERVWKKMGDELRLSHQIQRLTTFPWLFNAVVRRANRNPAIRTMMTMMFENIDIRKELKRPGFYWQLFSGRA